LSSSVIYRKFGEELSGFIGRAVVVESADGKQYKGQLLALDEKLNLILDKVGGAGENVFKLVLNGENVKEIRLMEKPFDFRALSERLNRVFPDLVRTREDIGAIIVMEKIKVTEKGVVEGTGLAAEKVKAIYDEFIRDARKH
jgi:small nuclear ribonucleoprotein (snRNP)-like protein